MHFFYSDEVEEDYLILRGQELQHLAKSLRAREGDEIWVLDGLGSKYRCVLIDLNKSIARAEVKERERQNGHQAKLHLAIAPTKNINRIEWLVEKATEMGIDQISFLSTARSERVRLKLDRIRKIAISALKQSGNLYLPRFADLQKLSQFIQQGPPIEQKFIAHCQTPSLPYLGDEVKPGQDTTILIGPEGDFTIEEVELCREAGFREISLGSMRLRTETAGIFVTSVLALLNKY